MSLVSMAYDHSSIISPFFMIQEKENQIVSEFQTVFENRKPTSFFSFEDIAVIDAAKKLLQHSTKVTFVAIAKIIRENFDTASPFFDAYNIIVITKKPSKDSKQSIKMNSLGLVAISDIFASYFFSTRHSHLNKITVDNTSRRVFKRLRSYIRDDSVNLETSKETFFPLFRAAYIWQIPSLKKKCTEELLKFCQKSNQQLDSVLPLAKGACKAQKIIGNAFKSISHVLIKRLVNALVTKPYKTLYSVLPNFPTSFASTIASVYIQKNLSRICSSKVVSVRRFFSHMKTYCPHFIRTDKNPFEGVSRRMISLSLRMYVSKENDLDLRPLEDFAKWTILSLPEKITHLYLSRCPSIDNLDLFQITPRCRKIETFMISHSRITNLTAFIGLLHLERLYLSRNPHLISLDGIDSLDNLTHLDVSFTDIKSYEGLGGLKKLKVLNLKGIQDIQNKSLLENIKPLISNNDLSLQVLTDWPMSFNSWHSTHPGFDDIEFIEGFRNLSIAEKK